MDFDFIVATDFEATCDENFQNHSARAMKRNEGEIIEFPLVLVDLRVGRVVDSVRWYVRPQLTPITPYCTHLTHITADMLDGCSVLLDVLNEADQWIRERVKGGSFIVVTHGHFDIKAMLEKEAIRKGFYDQVPVYWWRYIDITHEVLRRGYNNEIVYFGDSNPLRYETRSQLVRLCRALDIPTDSKLHTGIGDAMLVAELLIKMAQFQNTGTRLIAPPIDLQQQARMSTRVIRLFALPFEMTRSDFADYCKETGIEYQHAYIAKWNDRLLGIGYLVFEDEHKAQAAFAKLDCQEINYRMILAFRATMDEFEAARDCLVDLPEVSPFPVYDDPGPKWLCSICRYTNSTRRKSCFKCHAMMPGYALESGEWVCVACQRHNRGHRFSCLNCRQPNPNPPPAFHRLPAKALKPGEWICPNDKCCARNYPDKSMCYRCDSDHKS